MGIRQTFEFLALDHAAGQQCADPYDQQAPVCGYCNATAGFKMLGGVCAECGVSDAAATINVLLVLLGLGTIVFVVFVRYYIGAPALEDDEEQLCRTDRLAKVKEALDRLYEKIPECKDWLDASWSVQNAKVEYGCKVCKPMVVAGDLVLKGLYKDPKNSAQPTTQTQSSRVRPGIL